MQLFVQPNGTISCLYQEQIDLTRLGRVSISRASHVEPNEQGHWIANLSPVAGPKLGPYDKRSQALLAEENWLQSNCLAANKN